MPSRRRRSLRFWVMYAGYLVLFFAGVNYAGYWLYYRRITAGAPLAGEAAQQRLDGISARLGRLAPGRPGGFADFPREKPAGTIRIGCFGDSFTYGNEVAEGSEYASVLRELLRRRGIENVEVLNFGNPGFGFHQTFLMYDLLGSEYALDYAVFLPFPKFWRARDVTFNFWVLHSPTLGFHSRYVLRGGELERIDVVGDSEAERWASYNAFVPPLRYLRYDSRPPAALRAWLPARLTVPNPFYYRDSGELEREADETYRAFLARLAADDRTKSIVLDVGGEIEPLVDPEGRERLRVVRLAVPARFPYAAPNNHYSPWGHRLVAEHLLRLFGIDRDRPIQMLTIDDMVMADQARDADGRARRPRENFSRVSVDLAGVEVGQMVRFESDAIHQPLQELPRDAAFLVVVRLSGEPLIGGLVLGLPSPPRDLKIVAEEGGERTELEVRLEPLSGPVALLDLCSPKTWGRLATLTGPPSCMLARPWDHETSKREVAIRIDGTVRLIADFIGSDIRFRPIGTYYRFSPASDGLGWPELGSESGGLDLSFHRAHGATLRVPMGFWKRENVEDRKGSYDDLRAPRSKSRSPTGPRLTARPNRPN